VQIPLTSVIYMYVPIEPPSTIPDVTVYQGEVALIADDGTEPLDTDYYPADWVMWPGPLGAPQPNLALLVGGAAVYETGDYMAFARVTAGAEVPVLKSGRVRIGVAGD
jgi:hypothetical protein